MFSWAALMCTILCVGRYYVWSSASWSLFIMFGCFIAPGSFTFPLCIVFFMRDCYFKYSKGAEQVKESSRALSSSNRKEDAEAKESSPEGVTDDQKIDVVLDTFINREQ